MKKILLCVLAVGLMVPAMAQRKTNGQWSDKVVPAYLTDTDLGLSSKSLIPIKPNNSIVEIPVEGWIPSGLSEEYDRQSQGTPYPMSHVFPDGFIGSTWTTEDNTTPFPGASASFVYRGVGYSFSTDNGNTWSTPTNRVGGIPLYWPSYTALGTNGEAILARAGEDYPTYGVKDGLVLLTRENKGEGDWNIIPVPNPPDLKDGDCLAWSRMISNGYNNETLHVVTGVSIKDTSEAGWFRGYKSPLIYSKTSDGGATWAEWRVVTELVDWEWNPRDSYNDDCNWTKSQDNTIALAISAMFYDANILKSEDDGETWTLIPLYESYLRLDGIPNSTPTDTGFAICQVNIAFDNNNKLHAVYAANYIRKGDQPNYYSYYYSPNRSLLAYWNEDMGSYNTETLSEILWEAINAYILDGGEDYIIVADNFTPPVVGSFIPLMEPNKVGYNSEALSWAIPSYATSGLFTMPSLAFIRDTLHVYYIGVLDTYSGGAIDANNHIVKHPFHICSPDGGETWSKTDYLVNYIEVIDWEFAYPNLAGVLNSQAYWVAQCDQYAGTYLPYSGREPDQSEKSNNYYYLIRIGYDYVGIPSIESTPLTMSLMPNPALGQVTVKFDGKANITVHNLLGQQVYHVENVENTKVISTDNMQSGVYFVTVRSGNRTQTQKLIVR